MSLVHIRVMVKTSDSEVWEPVNVKFQPNDFNEAPNKDKFIKNLASKAFIGSKIEEVEYNYGR